MNVFVLNTGRCGSTTFIRACQHITNYSASHESNISLLGDARVAFPPNHIEADNRLSWFLGRLDDAYGDDAVYVHLTRSVGDAADSFEKRAGFGIMKAYREGIMMLEDDEISSHQLALDYIYTVERNIALFLKDKTRIQVFRLENAKNDFRVFWSLIRAEGNLATALKEWDILHNASG